MSKIIFSEEGWDDYIYWQGQDRKTLRKINRLLQSISRDGVLSGEGKPEKLKHKEGEYSRRIDTENRLVYEFSDEKITVKSCRGHYED
ncbi:MAG: Txe/YoeB family addiction module toxin [Treponema sp.]|nr:Txe/YoeB family addiction module toxin [Treponema sp.]